MISVVVIVAVRGRQDARSGSGLPPFLAPPFASRQKVEKQSSSKCLKRTKTFTATLRQAQGDKAGEAGAIAVKQND
jgi:hypothetical protein